MTSPHRVQRVVLYSRVSHTDEGSAKSVVSQRNELQAWAAREDWEIVEDLHEQGSASAYAKKKREMWPRVMDAIRSRTADALLTWEPSRATRDMAEHAQLSTALIEAKMLWGYGGSLHDPSEAGDAAMSGMHAVFAEYEAAKTRERVLRGVRANAEKGLPHGRLLYGYQRRYDGVGEARQVVEVVEDPVRGRVVREAARRVIASESMSEIARDFNARGLPVRASDSLTPDEKPPRWTASHLRLMLSRPGYAGQRVYQGEVIGQAAWKPLVSPEDWDILQARFEAASTGPRGSGRPPTHLLTGIAACGVCGGPLRIRRTRTGKRKDGTSSGQTWPTLSCVAGVTTRGAGFHVTMREDYVDHIVTETVIRRLAEPDVLDALGQRELAHEGEAAQLRSQIDKDEAYLAEVEVLASEQRDPRMLTRQNELVRPRINEARQRLRELQAGVDPDVRRLAAEPDVRRAWESMGMERRRRVVRALLVPAVMPATRKGIKGIDAERVAVHWH